MTRMTTKVMRKPVKFGKYVVDFGSRTLKFNLIFAIIVALLQIPELNQLMESIGGRAYEVFLSIKFWILAIANMWLRLKSSTPALIKQE